MEFLRDPSLLFLIYINNLCNVSKALDLLLIADDTSIFFNHSDPAKLFTIANNELAKLSDWFAANKLSINIKKSNFMMFRTRQKRQTLDGLKVCLCNNEIKRVQGNSFFRSRD